MSRYDIAIVGAGLTGMAAALVAARTGASVIHFAPGAPADRRTSALMTPTVEFLTDSGLIDDPGAFAVPLNEIRIIDATGRLIRAPETLFRASETGQNQFGWNFPNADLLAQFATRGTAVKTLQTCASPAAGFAREDTGIAVTDKDGKTHRARLLVGADGKASPVRQWAGIATRRHAFRQSALVCDLELTRPVGNTSVEFHYRNGPFTLVPAGGNKANLVWIDDKATLEAARALPQQDRDAVFYDKSEHLFGPVKSVFAPVVFPLSTLSVARAAASDVLVLGEAAHAFPPIGAQGLNLGLRDVADFAAALAETPRSDAGWPALVASRYAERRSGDLLRTGATVDALFRSLISDFLPVQAGRALGLWALRLLPPLRHRAMAVGMGRR